MQEALYYRTEEDRIYCLLCPKGCRLSEGQTGLCGVRKVEDGKLWALNYGCLAAANCDPVEKKPLYHFYPGENILSIGTFGCNFHCSFCQNWSLARGDQSQCFDQITPEQVPQLLEHYGPLSGKLGIAYTYNEPSVWFEFVLETAKTVHEKGYKNVLVTNGFINTKPLQELLPYIDAMNIDVKGFSDNFYNHYCRGELKPVIETVEQAVEQCHVEITCLLIPGLNDSAGEQEELARWLAGLSPDLVLHYSRYFPQYKLNLPATPVKILERSLDIARRYLHYVYPGNVDLPGAADTFCPHCANLLIMRNGYKVKIVGLDSGQCNNCGNKVNIIMADH